MNMANTTGHKIIGKPLIYYEVLDSTNLKAQELAEKGAAEGTIVQADRQSAGKGRLGRIWKSPSGSGLWFTTILRPQIDPKYGAQATLLAAVAVVETLAVAAEIKGTIKWPNDIYYNDLKLGGVLIENTIIGNQIKNTVIGIGINVNQQFFPPDLIHKSTSLHQILQKNVNLEMLLADLCSQIEVFYLNLRAKKEDLLRKAYTDKLYKINITSLYRQNGEVFEGTITGVSDSGLLNMNTSGKLTQFNFKEVEFLRV